MKLKKFFVTLCSHKAVSVLWQKFFSQNAYARKDSLFQFFSEKSGLSETAVTNYQQKQAQLQEHIEHLGQQIEQLKQQRKQTPHHLSVAELPEGERFSVSSRNGSSSWTPSN